MRDDSCIRFNFFFNSLFLHQIECDDEEYCNGRGKCYDTGKQYCQCHGGYHGSHCEKGNICSLLPPLRGQCFWVRGFCFFFFSRLHYYCFFFFFRFYYLSSNVSLVNTISSLLSFSPFHSPSEHFITNFFRHIIWFVCKCN